MFSSCVIRCWPLLCVRAAAVCEWASEFRIFRRTNKHTPSELRRKSKGHRTPKGRGTLEGTDKSFWSLIMMMESKLGMFLAATASSASAPYPWSDFSIKSIRSGWDFCWKQTQLGVTLTAVVGQEPKKGFAKCAQRRRGKTWPNAVCLSICISVNQYKINERTRGSFKGKLTAVSK